MADAGDVDGDGRNEIVVSSGLAPLVEVYCGADGSLLFDIPGGDSTKAVDGAGDFDGDGFSDLLVGRWPGGPGGLIEVYTSSAVGSPPHHRVRGVGCVSGNGHMPRIDLHGRSQLGTTPTITLRGAQFHAPAALALGNPSSIPLDAVGGSECALLTTVDAVVPVATDANGLVAFDVALSSDPVFAGFELEFQWLIVDAAAPRPLGVAVSNSLRFVAGL